MTFSSYEDCAAGWDMSTWTKRLTSQTWQIIRFCMVFCFVLFCYDWLIKDGNKGGSFEDLAPPTHTFEPFRNTWMSFPALALLILWCLTACCYLRFSSANAGFSSAVSLSCSECQFRLFPVSSEEGKGQYPFAEPIKELVFPPVGGGKGLWLIEMNFCDFFSFYLSWKGD